MSGNNRSLEAIRKEIDLIDQQLVATIMKRIELSKEVSQIKAEQGQAIFDPAREQVVINQLKATIDAEHHVYLETLYQLIFDYSKEVQKRNEKNNV